MYNTKYFLTYKGETKPLYQWAKEYNITYDALRKRIAKGYSVHDSLTLGDKETPLELKLLPKTSKDKYLNKIIRKYKRKGAVDEALEAMINGVGEWPEE